MLGIHIVVVVTWQHFVTCPKSPHLKQRPPLYRWCKERDSGGKGSTRATHPIFTWVIDESWPRCTVQDMFNGISERVVSSPRGASKLPGSGIDQVPFGGGGETLINLEFLGRG